MKPARFHLVVLVGTLMLLGGVGGCQRALVQAPNPVEIDPAEYRRIFKASIEVLEAHGFILDRQDYRFGRITTRPLNAENIVEPFYRTSTTLYQSWENTLNDQRRVVRVLLEPVEVAEPTAEAREGEQGLTRTVRVVGEDDARSQSVPSPEAYTLEVEVMIERHQRPQRFLTGASQGGATVGALQQVPAELQDRGIMGSYWQPLRRDPILEQRLVQQIIRRSFEMQTAD